MVLIPLHQKGAQAIIKESKEKRSSHHRVAKICGSLRPRTVSVAQLLHKRLHHRLQIHKKGATLVCVSVTMCGNVEVGGKETQWCKDKITSRRKKANKIESSPLRRRQSFLCWRDRIIINFDHHRRLPRICESPFFRYSLELSIYVFVVMHHSARSVNARYGQSE